MNKYSTIHRLLLAFILCPAPFLLPAQQGTQDALPLILLKEKGTGIEFDRVWLTGEKELIIDDPLVISVILPLTEGKSANLVRPDDRRGSIIASNSEGTLTVNFMTPEGTLKEFPGVSSSDLRSFSIRVNIIRGDGLKKAYRIAHYDEIQVDDGPVLDLFGGMIPLGEKDYSITLETSLVKRTSNVTGIAPFVIADGWIMVEGSVTNGGSGRFIFDTGASGGLVVTQSMLPPETKISELRAISYSTEGEKSEKGRMVGATGAVEDDNFLGIASLPQFCLGDMHFNNMEVKVLKEMPDFLKALDVTGIIGLELMKQAEVIQVTGLNTPKGTIEFQRQPPGLASSFDLSVPFQSAGNLLFIPGQVSGIPTEFLLDTGARKSIFTDRYAENNGITYTPTGKTETAGISGTRQEALLAAVPEITLGEHRFSEFEFMLSPHVTITGTLGLEDNGAILGMNFFSRFRSLRLDFISGLLSLQQ